MDRDAPHKARVFGRGALLTQLRQTAADEHVVLCGPPGVGKTTLARELAAMSERAVWCDLTDARDEAALVAVATAALGLEPRPGESALHGAARVADALRKRAVPMLVLDNSDHVAEYARIVGEWGQGGTRLVLTSRSPYPLQAAAQVAVEPLDEDAAIELFATRAAAAAPGFRVDDENEPTLRDLVRRLDRLPLPIELAAARSHVLKPRQILDRMDQRLATLTDQRSGRSLVSALQWTFDLLTTDEQICLARCSILRGSFGFADVEAVVRLDDAMVLDVVDRLVTAGWIRSRWDEATRAPVFEIFESVRDFASALLSAEEQSQTQAAYALHLSRWAEVLAGTLGGPDGVRAFAELVARESTLRWAAEYWLDRRRVEGPALLAALEFPILFHSRVVDWNELVKRGCTLAEEHDLAIAVRLLSLRGQMDLLMRNMAAAEEGLRHAHALARQTRDEALVASSARALGIALAARDLEAADSMLSGALAGARDTQDELLQARTLERIGFVRNRQFRLGEAFEAFERAHDILLRVSNPLFVGESLAGMAYVGWRRGDLPAAHSSFAEAVSAHASAGNRTREAGARFNLGAVLHALGRLDEARSQYDEATSLWNTLALLQYVPAAMVRRALLETEEGAFAPARRMAQQARAEASEGGDRHNVALADGVIAFTRIAQGRAVDREALEGTLATINMGADPIALCAHLALLIGTSEDPAMRDHLASRVDELQALAAQEDRYVHEALHAIDRLARGLAALASVSQQVAEQHQVIGHVRAAEEALEQSGVQNSPYGRLLAAWFVQRRSEVLAGVDLSAGRRLLVHREAHWFQMDAGEVVDLTSRKPLRLLLRHFVELAAKDRLAGTPVLNLIPVGWPGENVSASAGKNRVYTAIRFLREMGLEGVLVTGGAGYQIAADVTIEPVSDL